MPTALDKDRRGAGALIGDGYPTVFIHPSPEDRAIVSGIYQSLRERMLLPFLGAGLSIDEPANIPGSDGLAANLRALLLDSSSEIGATPAENKQASEYLR